MSIAHPATIARGVAARPARAGMTGTGRVAVCMLLLVIFEGAIRKWIAPNMTEMLILLRDMLALGVCFHACKIGALRRTPRLAVGMLAWTCCVVGWGLVQLVLGQSSFPVFLIGLRFWLLYPWFSVAAASVMTERDYAVTVRILLVTLLMMAPLVVVQHYAPTTSLLNSTPDTEPDDIFTSVQGVVRTTGTFTFTAGFVYYLSMCAPFVLGLVEARKRSIAQLLYALTTFGCLAVGALVSGARGAVVAIAGALAVYLLGTIVFAPMRKKGRALVTVVVVFLAAAAMLYVFSDAVTATQERFATASEAEDFGDRVVSMLFGEPWTREKSGVLGAGIGLGSNLAQFLQAGIRSTFALGETEAGRSLIEGGLLGWAFVILKFAAAVTGLVIGLALALRTRTVLPLLIWAVFSMALLTWPVIGQITANGMFGLVFLFALLSVRYPRPPLSG